MAADGTRADAGPVIEPGSEVRLNFSLALTGGGIIDSNFGREPARFRLGDGSMLPGFEEVLLGLAAGGEVERTIPARRAFGEANPRNRHVFPAAGFERLPRDGREPVRAGSVVSFRNAAGLDLPGVVSHIDGRTVGVDFNHPLAGRDIVFRARIASVSPAAAAAEGASGGEQGRA